MIECIQARPRCYLAEKFTHNAVHLLHYKLYNSGDCYRTASAVHMHLAVLYTQYHSDRALVNFLLTWLVLETYIVVDQSTVVIALHPILLKKKSDGVIVFQYRCSMRSHYL